jgi:hypothetical protein
MSGESEELPMPEEQWSFADFLGVSRSSEQVMNLASRVLGFDKLDDLIAKLHEHGIGPDGIDDLRSNLAFRRRKNESDSDFDARIRAVEVLITARGKMAWKPGERGSETTDIQDDSVRSGVDRRTRRPEKRTYPEASGGDEFGDERD